jgi:hypothetical protein
MVPTAPLCSKRNLTVKYIFVLRSTWATERAYLGIQISSGTSGLDQYSLRYRVGGNSVNTKPVSGSSVNRKSVSGSSVISKVFGGNPVNCRIDIIDIIASVSALIYWILKYLFEIFKILYLGGFLKEQLAFNTKAFQYIINNLLSRKCIRCFKEHSF